MFKWHDAKWYDAKEVHPAKECWVVVITERDKDLGMVMSVLYEDGCFNGKKTPFNDVICWAYEEDFKKVFNDFTEEDDF